MDFRQNMSDDKTMKKKIFVNWAVFLVGALCLPAYGKDMCTIQGSNGACKVQAFIGAEFSVDPDSRTCRKLKGATYQGACVNGAIQGLVLLKRPNESHYFSDFHAGIPSELGIIYTPGLIGVSYGGRHSTGCVYFGRSGSKIQPWDRRTLETECLRAKQKYGDEMMSDATFQSILEGRFVLSAVTQSTAPSSSPSARTITANSSMPVASSGAENQEVAKAVAERICDTIGGSCREKIADVAFSWLAKLGAAVVSDGKDSPYRFALLFSNPGAIAEDTVRLHLFEEALLNKDFVKDLNGIVLGKRIGDTTNTLAEGIFMSIMTGLVTEQLARYHERQGRVDEARMTRIWFKPLAESTFIVINESTATSGITATGTIWAKNIVSFALLGARLNADEIAGRDFNNQLRDLAARNASITETLIRGQLWGVMFDETDWGTPITPRHAEVLQSILTENYELQNELLSSSSAVTMRMFGFVNDAAQKFADLVLGITGGRRPIYSGLEHAHSTPALSGNIAPLTISQSITSSPVPSTPKIGKIIDTRVIGSGNGCSCTFELTNSDVSAGLNQSIFFGADYRMTDGKAWMNINGRDVELLPMGSKITSNENDPVRPMSHVYSGDGMTASIDYRQIDSCPPEQTQCEVNRYDITVTLETGGLRETVKGKGSCGC